MALQVGDKVEDQAPTERIERPAPVEDSSVPADTAGGLPPGQVLQRSAVRPPQAPDPYQRLERASAISSVTRIVVVAHRTAATPRLLEEVRPRAHHGACAFLLLVPRPYWDPETEEAAKVIELAVPLLEQAAGGSIEAIVGDTDPFVAVREALERAPFDEVIISTLPRRVSHWLRLDLPARVERLGVPVTVVTGAEA